MKKTKILVPAIAVLALGIAASTTATVAWFTVSTKVNVSQASTGQLVSLKSNTQQTSNILWTVAPSTSAPTLDLTDNTGKSFYWDTATGAAVQYTPSAPSAVVTYNATAALKSGANDTTFKQAYMQMYDDHSPILLQITADRDLRIDMDHATTATHAFNVAKGATKYFNLAEAALQDSDESKAYSVTFTVSVEGHTGAEDFTSWQDLYETSISVAVGYADDATGTNFTAYAVNA
jgi:hypothetical protein